MTSSTGTPHPTTTSGTPHPTTASGVLVPHQDGPPARTAPLAEPMTTMLPAMRVPADGPVAPRIALAPPVATDLPAAGFIWSGVSGLGYESRLDDGPWRPAQEGWFAVFIDLPAGPHHFYVRSIDPHDGSRSAAARYDWVVGA